VVVSGTEGTEIREAPYRLRPTVWVGIAVVLAYVVLVFGLQLSSGLEYTEWTDTAEHGIRAAVIPLGAGVVLLVAFLAFARWDMVWRDPERLPMTRAMNVAIWFFVIAIVIRFALTDWGAVDVPLVLVIIGAGVLVGFAEEALFRGIVLRTLRTGGRDEARAALWTSVGFGLFHLPNLLVSGGEPLQLVQVAVAGITGVALYLFRRRWGFILPAMIAHGIWDMSSFLSATNDSLWAYSIGFVVMIGSVVVGIVALVSIWRKDQGVVVTPQGVNRPSAAD
jgi:membrane protease YdiL (CAAX protease family)